MSYESNGSDPVTFNAHPTSDSPSAKVPKEPKSCESNGSDLVTFNVGGKIYQVLREPTLSLHPTSLLTQMAEGQKDDEPIFIEGDQELFKFVIEYHRDRKVILPIHVSTNAVLRELKRFGLEPTAEQITEDGVCLSSVKKQLINWEAGNRERKQESSFDLLSALVAEAAAKLALDRGPAAFSIRLEDFEKIGLKRNESWVSLFTGVDASELAQSESVQEFARTFGYSVEGRKGSYPNGYVQFKPAQSGLGGA